MELFEQLRNEPTYWIRFELGLSELDERSYLEEVYHRAQSIFNFMFAENDEMLLVASEDYHIDDKSIYLPNIKRLLRNKKLIYGLTHETLPFQYDEEDAEMETIRYSLKVKKEDLHLDYMIRKLGNRESHRKPRMNGYLYIVNITRKTLFNMYDERGCDVYSLEKEDLLPLYNESRKWILDYNRIEIDRSFEGGLYNHFETHLEMKRREKTNEQKIKETKINLYVDNTCHITHELEIPKENAEVCLAEMNQTGFQIDVEKELGDYVILKVMKTEALALIDYQTELICLYSKKYGGNYKGWSIVKGF